MKVKVCIAILAFLVSTVCESEGSPKAVPKKGETKSIEPVTDDVKDVKAKESLVKNEKSLNGKHKRGIFHYGTYGTGLGWPSAYASVFGYNLNLPSHGLQSARGYIHGYPIVQGLPTGYGVPVLHGVQPVHGVHAVHGVPAVHNIPTLHSVQGGLPINGVHAVHGAHSIHGAHALHGIPAIHGVHAGVPAAQDQWQFKTHTTAVSANGTPFVLKPGGAVVSSLNVNYPHNHYLQVPPVAGVAGVAGIPVSPAISVSQSFPIAPSIPFSPGVPVAPGIPVSPSVPVAPPLSAVPIAPASPAVPAIPVAPAPPQIPTAPTVPSQPNFPNFVFQIVPARPTPSVPLGPAVPPSQFFPNIGVLPLQPSTPILPQPTPPIQRPQRPPIGSAEAAPQIPPTATPQPLPPSPTQQPWRPIFGPQQPQHPQKPQQPQHPQQPPTTVATIPDFIRPSITLLPPFVSQQQGGEALSPGQISSNNAQFVPQGYRYGLGERIQPSLFEGLTDEEIQRAIVQANYQAQLHQNSNRGYQY